MSEILLWITGNQEILITIGLVSAVVFFASLVSLPWLVAMIPTDYFMSKKRQRSPWKEKFPAICNGNYLISSNTIEFENVCVWTAEFDWTLILGENWNYTKENNILIMTKSNGDKYTLTKQ